MNNTTELILKRLYRQKLHQRQTLGSGNAPRNVLNMNLYDFLRRLGEIHFLLARRLYVPNQSQTLKNAAFMLRTLLPTFKIQTCYLIKDQFAGIYLPQYGLILDESAQAPSMDEFQHQILPITAKQLGTQMTDIANALKTKTFHKLESYRIKKLFRDICIGTISYWVSNKDIYQLLLMESLDDVSLQAISFHSPILMVKSEQLIQNVA